MKIFQNSALTKILILFVLAYFQQLIPFETSDDDNDDDDDSNEEEDSIDHDFSIGEYADDTSDDDNDDYHETRRDDHEDDEYDYVHYDSDDLEVYDLSDDYDIVDYIPDPEEIEITLSCLKKIDIEWIDIEDHPPK